MKHYGLLAILVIASCSSGQKLLNDEYTVIKFKEKFPYGYKTIMQKYALDVPKGGKVTKGSYDFTGDYHTEYRIAYADSSIFYIGNSNWSGSRLNVVNRFESGVKSINKKHEKDSFHFDGLQKNGLYWKEHFLGDIIVGYVNVRQDERAKYDSSIQSIRTYE